MGRFTLNGKAKEGTDSEEFHNMMREAGPVECKVCKTRFGDGKKGLALQVCAECLDYFCLDHEYRHPNCSNGR